jgi:hypothetical protein
MATKNTILRPSKVEAKADTTTQVAKGIIAAETSAREANVARLRKARLEKEAAKSDTEAEAPRSPRRRQKS